VVIEPAAIFRGHAARKSKVLLWPLCVMWMLAATSLFAGNFYAGTSPGNVPWPGGIVPYEFTNTLTAAQQKTYFDGLREWQLAANVSFVPHTTETRWILFAYNTNYIDNVSPGFSPQVVTISSLSRAQVCHEMGHSFGFTHENIRPDATNFITVISNNVTSGNLQFFQIDPTSVTNGNYDFESVMHLGWDFASTQPGVLATQQPKPPFFPRYQFRMGNLCLSPGDRAALKFLYGPPAVPLTNIVTTTADFGQGSLRAAMYYATEHPGSSVKFNIPTSDAGYSNGVFNIHLTGHLPPLVTNGMVIDGSTQPSFAGSPLIFVDGSQIIPETFTSNSGLLIHSSSNQVKNISFSGFNWNGLTLEFADATNNTIAGCWLGLDSTGTNAAPNANQGIYFVQGASHNIIGGTNALARNVISGNAQYGLWMSDTNTTGNVILGNYIGTDASGSLMVSNALGGLFLVGGTSHNIIGGTNAGAGNVISGNLGNGILLRGSDVINNTVQGNFIGTDVTGMNPLPNTVAGVTIDTGSSSNLIGGTVAGARNVISGNNLNYDYGVIVANAGTSGNLVEGNYIGLGADGLTAVSNFFGMVCSDGAANNTFGGTVTGARNVISGNYEEGLRLTDAGTTANMVQGNFIGTDLTGTNALPNGFAGLTIFFGATSNTIGGTSISARNIISGNYYGLVAANAGTSGNLIQGNYIGLAPDGFTAVPNFHGVLLSDHATNNTLGGTTSAARNLISGNNGSGIFLTDEGTSGNFIQGNFIGPGATGASATPNGNEGIYIVAGASGNFIGGTSAGAGNVISGNTYRGIYAYGTNTSGNLIQGNFIGTKADGTNALGNNWDGVVFFDGASSNVVGLATDGSGTGNRIAFNGFTGIYAGSDNSDVSLGNTIRGNTIYSNNYIGINLAGGVEDFYGVTANDFGDADTGPNDLQNFPVITNAFGYAASTIVSGTLNSAASSTFSVDVYRNFSADPSDHGQGQFYVGTASVTTDGSGNGNFSLTNFTANYAGQFFTATATAASGDTSEFGADVLATNAATAFAQFAGPFQSQAGGFIFNLTMQTNFNYRIQAATNLSANPILWIDLTNFTAVNGSLTFTDRTATNFRTRFYRIVSP
jgi:Astacin (Peptidase family M12A)